MKNSEFAHLHVHNEFSLLDGIGTADEWASTAAEMGFQHLALTNHGNVDGCVRFQNACDENKIHGVMGVEGYIVPDMTIKKGGPKSRHIVLLAMNKTGWQNILKMLSLACLYGFYYRPRIDPRVLLDNLDGVLVMTACCNSIIHMSGSWELLTEIASRTQLWLEAMPVDMDEQRDTNRIVLELHREKGWPIVATSDCHYIRQEQWEHQEVLLAMQSKKRWADPKRWKFSIQDLYMKTADEMYDSFVRYSGMPDDKIREAMGNSTRVAELCQFHIDPIPVVLPTVEVPQYSGENEVEQLLYLTLDGLDAMFRKHSYLTDGKYQAYHDRVMEELELIVELGYERYFLIVWELINWCKDNDIMVGPGRGSVGGCIVAWALGITMVDPLRWNLVFSRFISPGRIDLPDIDMDFEDRYRDRIFKHLQDVYGKDNVAGLSNFTKMNGRSAIRKISWVFEHPKKDVDAAAKSIVVRSLGDFRSSFTIEDAFNTFEDGIKFKEKYPATTKFAVDLEGQVIGSSRHAAAMCVISQPMKSGANACYARRAQTNTCNWDKYDAETMGLMKLDVLGLNTLTVLHEAQDLIMLRHSALIDFDTIPLDDGPTLAEFTRGNTAGVFQFNSPSMIKMIRDIKCEDIEEVVALNALNRPGCLRSGMANDFKDRKHGIKRMPDMHDIMRNITKDTQGIVLYQEQIMAILYELGGLPWKTADMVRKVVSKSKGEEQFLKFRKMFIDGCVNRGTVDADGAGAIFDEMKHFGSYGFNRAHAVEYGLIAYWCMWLKVHYPLEFLSAMLSWGPKDDRMYDHVAEARRLGIKVQLPHVNYSEPEKWAIDGENNFRIPISNIKGVGPVAAKEIVKARNADGPFETKDALISRVAKRKVHSGILKKLEDVHALPGTEIEPDEPELIRLSETYFGFNLSNDPMFMYRSMIERMSGKMGLHNLETVTTDRVTEQRMYFGRIIRVKFGYREKVSGSKDGSDSKGLGGVYGTLDDGTGFSMLTFSSDLYQARKDEIEHCSGRHLLVRANSPFPTDSIYGHNVWFGDDLLKGDLAGIGVEMADTILDTSPDHLRTAGLAGCSDCKLRQESTSPVYPTPGQSNIMIVVEAPNYRDDQSGQLLSDNTGDILFNGSPQHGVDGLFSLGLERPMFHITSFNKCYPSQSKSPDKKAISSCRKWLDAEVDHVKPYIMLVFGNTAMKFFHGKDGITKQCEENPVEWYNRYKCWICWCPQPASVYHSASNATLLNQCLQTFAEKVAIIGYGVDPIEG